MDLKRPVPLWLFITGLLIVGAVSAGAYYLPRLLTNTPDFQLSLNPAAVTVRPEPTLTTSSYYDANASQSSVTVKSLNGFTGSVSFSATYASGISGSLAASYIVLGSDAGLFGLNTSTTMRLAATSLGDYRISVLATSGSRSHIASLVVHSRDLGVLVSQTTLAQGSSIESQIAFSSLNGFGGNLTLDESPHQIYSNGFPYNGRWFVNATLAASNLIVVPGTISTIAVTITAGDFSPERSYNFTTVATYGAWTWRVQVSAAVTLAPEPSLTLLGYSYGSSTNATLVLRNGGPAAIEITAYNVTDSAGDSVTACLEFPTPVGCYSAVIIGPSSTGTVNAYTIAYCGFCTMRGNPFSYMAGQTYKIVITTSRQHLFVYSISQ